MGSNYSRRRGGMSTNNDNDGGPPASAAAAAAAGSQDEEGSDLVTLLSYLIRSGQVRIIPGSLRDGEDDDDDDDDDDDEDEFEGTRKPPKVICAPDTSELDMSELRQQILLNSGRFQYLHNKCKPHMQHKLLHRELGVVGRKKEHFHQGDRSLASSNFLPNLMERKAKYSHKAFCGMYSQNGEVFLSACQDRNIRLYDSTNGQFKLFNTIRARDVGWSILDVAFSPDGNYLIYSSWSECIHLCNIYGDQEIHQALNLRPADSRFCIFSLTFSMDNREIMGGANDGCLYVYDRDCQTRTLKIECHDDDVNAVAFADETSNILFSGGDDGLLKVWDRRTLSEDHPTPVGTLAGHSDGITYIDSKGDARYLLSNCKDQSIKLWDIRKFASSDAVQATKRAVSKQTWDYRWQQFPKRTIKKRMLPGDSSVMTYMGHSVLHTLIRSRFSPEFTTGSRFIYTGCATGSVVVYDTLTGKIVTKLDEHRAVVRDASWHPYENNIMSTSWDGSIGLWTYVPQINELERDLVTDSDSDNSTTPRRIKRLKEQQIPRLQNPLPLH
ncbi:DDB1- and CUL4-associated factor 11-like [Tubulanus polymorphus]|uniref:DDB1- and CUL4-associated factor 11-like n=1 Tax=Tubulanus polymorphus TaxID=672921 RepID=UPI003DA5427D